MPSWSLAAASAFGLLALVARESETTGAPVLLVALAVIGVALALRTTGARPARRP